jgi:hypothetical protein
MDVTLRREPFQLAGLAIPQTGSAIHIAKLFLVRPMCVLSRSRYPNGVCMSDLRMRHPWVVP